MSIHVAPPLVPEPPSDAELREMLRAAVNRFCFIAVSRALRPRDGRRISLAESIDRLERLTHVFEQEPCR